MEEIQQLKSIWKICKLCHKRLKYRYFYTPLLKIIMKLNIEFISDTYATTLNASFLYLTNRHVYYYNIGEKWAMTPSSYLLFGCFFFFFFLIRNVDFTFKFPVFCLFAGTKTTYVIYIFFVLGAFLKQNK